MTQQDLKNLKNLELLADELGIKYKTLLARLKRNHVYKDWNLEDAIQLKNLCNKNQAIKDAALANNIGYERLRKKVKAGMTLEEAVEITLYNKNNKNKKKLNKSSKLSMFKPKKINKIKHEVFGKIFSKSIQKQSDGKELDNAHLYPNETL